MTASPGQIYEHDILGKRTWRNPFSSATVDGTTLTQTGTTYALGARGIDMLHPYSVDTSNATRTYGDPQFPLYDGHGNMAATLSRSSSSPYYAIANERTYDVWGGVRSGASTGDPNTRYCANLGHKQDDESGLIYMRARYYEPGTGRFVSEDPARDGWNWYVYCGNEPIARTDENGQSWSEDSRLMGEVFLLLMGGPLLIGLGALFDPSVGGIGGRYLALTIVGIMAATWAFLTPRPGLLKYAVSISAVAGSQLAGYLSALQASVANGARSGITKSIVYFYAGYSLLLISLLFADVLEGIGRP